MKNNFLIKALERENLVIPGPKGFKNLLKQSFPETSLYIKSELMKSESIYHFCLDYWSDLQKKSYLGNFILDLGITATFVNHQGIATIALQFRECKEDGKSMLDLFLQTMDEYEISINNCTITTDNGIQYYEDRKS